MTKLESMDDEAIRKGVRDHYGRLAEKAGEPSSKGCCSPSQDQTSLIYEIPEVGELPEEIRLLSAGCGDPVTLAELEPGQVVLDLGSGGGIDCFLAARKVGTSGYVIGVDMTPEMLAQARANKERMGMDNVEFRLGEIEHIPAGDESVDVIISNCVINLSVDKPQVFREAFRVLRPGGRLAVSDIVADGPLPNIFEDNLSAWAGCIAGAMDQEEYITELQKVGFIEVKVSPQVSNPEISAEMLEAVGVELPPSRSEGESQAVFNINGEWKVFEVGNRKPPFSARITARKPGD